MSTHPVIATKKALVLVGFFGLTFACSSGNGAKSGNNQEPSTTAAPAKLIAQHAGLIKLPFLAKLQPATSVPTQGYPGKKFLLGAVKSEADWQAFQAIAQLPLENIDFSKQVVIYAVLDAQTNSLTFTGFSAVDGTGKLSIQWEGIEPFYTDATPGVFAVVERSNLAKIDVHADRGEGPASLGNFAL